MNTRLMKAMISSFFASGLVSLVAAVALSTPAAARAESEEQTCTVHTLRGLYLFATSGFNIVNGVAQPKAIVEGIEFNGNGTLSSPFATVSINGNIIRPSGGVGSYTVDPNCRGTLTFSGGPSFDIFVQPQGNQLWMIQTGPAAAPPAVFEGIATRVSD